MQAPPEGPMSTPYNAPLAGGHYVLGRASAANDAVTDACGNLAPPTL